MQVTLRHMDEANGYPIGDIALTDFEANIDEFAATLREQGVESIDSETVLKAASWRILFGDTCAYAEILMEEGE